MMMPPCSCVTPGRKPGTSCKVIIGILKQSQNRTKRAAFHRSADIKSAGQHAGLLRNYADAAPGEPCKADDNVLGKAGGNLEEIALVDDKLNDLLHLVGLIRVVRDDRVQLFFHSIRLVLGLDERRILHIVRRNKAEKPADEIQTLLFVFAGEVGNSTDRSMSVLRRQVCSKVTSSWVTALMTFGPVMNILLVSLTMRMKSVIAGEYTAPTGAGPHYGRDLWYDAGGQCIAQKEVRVSTQADNTLLDAGASGVAEADDWGAVLHGHVHDLADFGGMGLCQRTAEHGKILRVNVDVTAVDLAKAGDDAVSQYLLVG